VYLLLASALQSIPYGRAVLWLIAAILVIASVKVVSIAMRSFTAQDPQQIVLDEIVGQIITLLPMPFVPQSYARYWWAVLAGFVLFRALDAAKPYPVWKLERLHGAWGVVADDVGAGVAGALLLAAILLRWQI
jgi:phosphatidylglycerophosphatase A